MGRVKTQDDMLSQLQSIKSFITRGTSPTEVKMALPTVTPQAVDNVLHDLLAVAIAAAAVFVKNPAHQERAAQMTQIAQELLPLLDAQLQAKVAQ